MRSISILAGVLILLSSSAYASSTVNVSSMSCSGAETSSFANFLSLSCAGNFSLIGGAISSDTKIALTASGSLDLENLSISAPQINLTAQSIDIGSGTTLASDTALYTGTGLTLTSGAGATLSIAGYNDMTIPVTGNLQLISPNFNINLNHNIVLAPVPEPDIAFMLPAGLVALAGIARKRKLA